MSARSAMQRCAAGPYVVCMTALVLYDASLTTHPYSGFILCKSKCLYIYSISLLKCE